MRQRCVVVLAALLATLQGGCAKNHEIYVNGLEMDEETMVDEIVQWHAQILASSDTVTNTTISGTQLIVRVDGKNVELWAPGWAEVPGKAGFVRLDRAQRKTADRILQFYRGRKPR